MVLYLALDLKIKQLKYGTHKVVNECKITLNEHSKGVLSLIQLRNGNFVSGSYDHTIKIWKHVNVFKH